MELKANAKINWDLHILGKRPDGYHELDTVMVTVDLHDTLNFEAGDKITLRCTDASLPLDDSNLVVRAAKSLAAASGYPGGAKIHLVKNIPSGGGMGGGSSDAACTLRGLNVLWNLNWTLDRLQPIAAALGSDVAFFLYGGWCRCTGRGEVVQLLPGAQNWPQIRLLLVVPPLHVATPLVYKALQPSHKGRGEIRSLTGTADQLMLNFSRKSQPEGQFLRLNNDLTLAACEVEPGLKAIQRVLEAQYPGRWLMSGSGGVHFVVAGGNDSGSRLEALLRETVGQAVRVLNTLTVASCY